MPHPAERLAAYLADELPADERLALEGELARDAALRAMLDGMRRADAELSALPATELPDGAAERLQAALAPELDAQLRPSEREADAAVTDDLSAGRARREARRRWQWPAIGAAAAGLVGVAVIGGVLQSGILGGADRAEVAADADAESAAGPMSATGDAAEEAQEPQEAAGPVLLAGDRELTASTADSVLDRVEVVELAAQGLSEDEVVELGARYASAFGAGPSTAARALTGEDAAADSDEELATPEATTPHLPFLRLEGRVDQETLDTVGRCLDEILAGGPAVVPVSAELVRFEGEPAIAYALVSLDPESGVGTRTEVWIVTRDDACDVRYFAPR